MRKFLRIVPLILVYAAIIYFSLKKPSGVQSHFKHIDKFYHFIAYFTLGLTVSISILNSKAKYSFLIFSLTLGLVIEFIQGTLPYRDMSVADGITNILGLSIGALIYRVFNKQIYCLFRILRIEKIFLDPINRM